MSPGQSASASPHETERWAIYLRDAARRDNTLDCVLLTDGAWMHKGSANKPETIGGRTVVWYTPRFFSTKRAARDYRKHYDGNSSRTYVAEWVQP